MTQDVLPPTVSSPKQRKRRRLLVAGLLVAACQFGSYEPIVPYARLHVPLDAALTVSVDGTTIWAVDQASTGAGYVPRLRVYDDSGNIVGSSWWGSAWAVRAMAPANEAGYEDVAWVLHANGYRIRWNDTLVGYSEIEVPIPTTGATAASGRLYCDMDHDQNGVQFITTVDTSGGSTTSYLYREPSEAVWERVALPTLNGKCGRVSYDGPADEVVVLDNEAEQTITFDADTLAAAGTTDISVLTGDPVDFAVIGAHAVIAVRHAGPTPDDFVIVDDAGAVIDTESFASLNAAYVHIQGDEVQAYWAGADSSSPVKYTAGYWTLID